MFEEKEFGRVSIERKRFPSGLFTEGPVINLLERALENKDFYRERSFDVVDFPGADET